MDWPGGEWKSCLEQHESKSWHCSATKTISRIRVIEVEQEFECVSSKCHQENCFQSWQAATQEPLKEELDFPQASPCLENSCPAFLRRAPSAFTGFGFPLTALRSKIQPRLSNPGLLTIPRFSERPLRGTPHRSRHKEGHTGRLRTPLKVKGEWWGAMGVGEERVQD